MKLRKVLGVDVGGSGIKAAIIDTKKGELLTERNRIPTPIPATPDNIIDVLNQQIKNFQWKGAVGIGFPSAIVKGKILTATNIDKSWLGINPGNLFTKKIGVPTMVVNDADAAGVAEMKFGAGINSRKTSFVITLGTGIGTSMFIKRKLIPNTELGHIYLDNGELAESYAAASVRENSDMSWDEWGLRLNKYLGEIERLFYPEIIIVGGGVSKHAEKFMHNIKINTKVVMAEQRNEAGMIGAAFMASEQFKV